MRYPSDTYKNIVPIKNIRNKFIEAIKNNQLSMFTNDIIEKFENKFAKEVGVDHLVTSSSGTSAILLTLLSLKLMNKNKNLVILPGYSYISDVNSVVLSGFKPIFVDIDPEDITYNLDALRKTLVKLHDKVLAIIVIDWFGNISSKIFDIRELASKYKVSLIEDASQAHFSKIRGIYAGSIGDIGIFSFMQNKIIRAGEGGAISTNNKKLYDILNTIRSNGEILKVKKPFNVSINYISLYSSNFRPSPLNFYYAYLCLRYKEKILDSYKKNATFLIGKLKRIGFNFNLIKNNTRYFWHIPILLNKQMNREKIITDILFNGGMIGIHFPIWWGNNKNAEFFAKKHIILPTYPALSKNHLELIFDVFIDSIKSSKYHKIDFSKLKFISGIFFHL